MSGVRASTRDLIAALDSLIILCGRTNDSLEDFEEQAAAFQRATGKMRPGKDAPIPELRATREEYQEWVDRTIEAAISTLGRVKKYGEY